MLIKSLNVINRFKLSRLVLEKVIMVLMATLKINKEMENQKEIYLLFDFILLNLFDILEDYKKINNYQDNSDT